MTYEYLHIQVIRELVGPLNDLAREGWRVVDCIPRDNLDGYLLEREKPGSLLPQETLYQEIAEQEHHRACVLDEKYTAERKRYDELRAALDDFKTAAFRQLPVNYFIGKDEHGFWSVWRREDHGSRYAWTPMTTTCDTSDEAIKRAQEDNDD